MTRKEVVATVRLALERGDLPRGGPSEVAAFDLLGELSPGYWQRWSEATAERILARERQRGES